MGAIAMRRTFCLAFVLLVTIGCGKKGEESLAKQAGGKVGETLTDFVSGVGKGVDKQLIVKVELSKSLADLGLSNTVSKAIPHGFSIYLAAAKPLKSKLVAKAFDKEDQEVGRCAVDVDFAADDAKYVSFTFQDAMDTQLVEKFLLDVKSEPPQE
jgi:hypothetical protein